MKTLAQFIAAHPERRTKKQWADHFGMSRSYFTEILHGKREPSREAMRKISEGTGGEVSPAVWFETSGGEAA